MAELSITTAAEFTHCPTESKIIRENHREPPYPQPISAMDMPVERMGAMVGSVIIGYSMKLKYPPFRQKPSVDSRRTI